MGRSLNTLVTLSGATFSGASFSTIVTAPPPDPNTVGLWHCNEGVGSLAYLDAVGGLNLTPINNATWGAAQTGFGASAASFPALPTAGANGGDFARGTGSPAINNVFGGSGNWTVEAFIFPTDGSTYRMILGIHDPAGQEGGEAQIQFDLTGEQVGSSPFGALHGVFFHSVSDVLHIFGNTVVPLNVWSHVAFVRDGINLRLFVAGQQDATPINVGTLSGRQTTATRQLQIGKFRTQPSFSGRIDEVRISNVARYTTNFTPPTTELS